MSMKSEESAETRTLFATYLGDQRAIPYASRYRDIFIRAISEGLGQSARQRWQLAQA